MPSAAVEQESLLLSHMVWLPSPEGVGFRADPFGLWHEKQLYVFVERLDFAEEKGRIEVLTYSEELDLLSIDLALKEAWHLSHPYVLQSGGNFWILPEARGAGRLTLYKASAFPFGWNAEMTIPVPEGAVDATPLFWKEKWWLFYCVRQGQSHRRDQLHISFAEQLSGPWQHHPLNPLRAGLSGCRPGGSPMIGDGYIDLPVQDASNGYGGALRRLRITVLDETQFEAEDSPWLDPPSVFAPFDDGLHTLSAAGDLSLLDVKCVNRPALARLFTKRRGR